MFIAVSHWFLTSREQYFALFSMFLVWNVNEKMQIVANLFIAQERLTNK